MLDKVKVFLGFSVDDTELDEKLEYIIEDTTARLKILLGGIEPPAELDYIVCDVAVMRFNRLGSEGMASHSVEGESITYLDDDFAVYKDEIQAWLETQKESTRGKVRFL